MHCGDKSSRHTPGIELAPRIPSLLGAFSLMHNAQRTVVVIGNGASEFTRVPSLLRDGQKVIDLVRIKADFRDRAQYAGICW